MVGDGSDLNAWCCRVGTEKGISGCPSPGRLIDFFKQKLFNLNQAEVMILDEADRMFDMGFIQDIRFLLRRLPAPEKRLNMLFSGAGRRRNI